MICPKNKLGHSQSQISELTGLTIDEARETLGQATGLSPEAQHLPNEAYQFILDRR
jgi:hypothetical protein